MKPGWWFWLGFLLFLLLWVVPAVIAIVLEAR